MSLSIFNFRINKYLKLILYFLISFFLLNLFIFFLPPDYSKDIYNDAISYSDDKPKEGHFVKNIKVIAFGDSKATQASTNFFNEPTLSFAAPNNTIIFSKFIFDKFRENPLFKPKYVILYIGPNNFNKNGIFPKRDFAIRRLASYTQLLEMAKIGDGLEYALDGLISKLIPIYGRRIEIRHPSNLWKLIKKKKHDNNKIPGMFHVKNVKKNQVKRDFKLDRNYALIYERSVYNEFALSILHTKYLENMIEDIIKLGATPIIVQLPVDKKIRMLRDKLVKNEFDEYITKIKEKYRFIYVNEVKNNSYEFLDANHLSSYGHKQFIEEKINPILKKYIK